MFVLFLQYTSYVVYRCKYVVQYKGDIYCVNVEFLVDKSRLLHDYIMDVTIICDLFIVIAKVYEYSVHVLNTIIPWQLTRLPSVISGNGPM